MVPNQDGTEEMSKRLQELEEENKLLKRAKEPAVPPPPVYKKPEVPASNKKVQPFIHKDLESYIGRWWLGIAGIVAILFGVSFFLKYAFDNNLIGPAARVALGVAGGLLLIVIGEFLRKKIEKYSYILTGGGLGLLYLSVYSAYGFYQLIGQSAAFVAMAFVTALGVSLALRSNSMIIAILASLGGFITPSLLSMVTVDDAAFFGYLVILNLGVLAVALFKIWRPLTLFSFGATILNFALWYGEYYQYDKLTFALTVLAIFFLIYFLTNIIGIFLAREKARTLDLFLLTANAAWLFSWYYYLLRIDYPHELGAVALALAFLHFGFAYAVPRVSKEDDNLHWSLLAIGSVFITIAVPLWFEQNVITIAWAAEAVALFILGLATKNKKTRFLSYGVFTIALARLFSIDSIAGDPAQYKIFLNKMFITYAVEIIAAGLVTYMAAKKADELSSEEKNVSWYFGIAVGALVFIAFMAEIHTFYDVKIYHLREKVFVEQQTLPPDSAIDGGFFNYQINQSLYDRPEYRSYINQRNAAVSIFLTLYSIILIALGIIFKNKRIRWTALALFGITGAKVFLYDLAALNTIGRVASFMVFGVILLVASYLYFRYENQIKAD